MKSDTVEKESLKDSAEHIEEEARMVLPGIQALFGFQLIAVFNEQFSQKLTPDEQILHWAALCLTAMATLLSLTPAAYHRVAEPGFISSRFVRLAGKWISSALVPLMLAICADLYLIGRIITGEPAVSAAVTGVLLVGFISFWFGYPYLERCRRAKERY